MSVFKGQTITKQGKELLARALAGEGKFEFTKGAFGEGKFEGDLELIEDLVDHKLDINVMDVVNDRGTAILTIQITNESLKESFFTNELGIFAKLEGDDKEILYSYAVAEKADAIPNNRLGTTYESVHDIYMDISSNTEASISVDESTLFLTLDIANKNYTQTGLTKRGGLEGRDTLEADKQYLGADGNWYKNVGGNREWNGNGEVDDKFIAITWNELQKTKEDKFEKKTGFNLDKVDDPEEVESLDEVGEGSFLVATGKALKKVWDKTLEVLGLVNDNKSAILNNEENISNSYFSRTSHDDLNILSFLIVENDKILDTVYSSSRLEKGYLVIDIAVNTLTTIKGHNIIATINLTGTDFKTNSFQVGVSTSDTDTRIREQLGIPGMLFDIAVLSDKIYKINIWKYSAATPNERSYATIKLPIYKY